MTQTDRQSLDERLQAAQRNLLALRHAHGEASLELAQGQGSDAELDALEEEITTAEKICRRLEAAVDAQAATRSDAAIAAREQQRQEARRQVDALGAELHSLALAMVSQVEGLGPLLAKFETLSDQRRAAATDAIRYPTKHTGKMERDLAAVAAHAALREGAVPAAVLAALWRTGMSRVLSTEAIGAILPSPDFYGSYGQGDIGQALNAHLDRINDQLTAHMERIDREHGR